MLAAAISGERHASILLRRGVQHLLSCPVNWGPLKPQHNIAVIRQEATMHSSSLFQTLYDALLINEIYWGLHFSHTHAAMNTSSFVLCRRTLFMAVRTFHMAIPNETMFLDGAAKNV